MIVLNSPKGWTGPKMVDGLQVEGTFRSHQVPLSDPATHPEHLKLLEDWLRSYRPEELFDEQGRLKPELTELAPKGERRMGANPHANGGTLLRDLRMPDFRDYAVEQVWSHRQSQSVWGPPGSFSARTKPRVPA
jgi:xylulose-5-phosphate/fructose-6-phosphate phosphoketolase